MGPPARTRRDSATLPISKVEGQLEKNLKPISENLKNADMTITNKENGNKTKMHESPSPRVGITDYGCFLNSVSVARRPSVLREIASLITKLPPDAIILGLGLPNESTFPFKEVKVTLKDNSTIVINNERLAQALQYLPSRGLDSLINLLKDFQDREHGTNDWNTKSIIMTCGSQEALCKIAEMTLERGDPVLLQHPVYSGVLDIFRPFKCEYITIDMDQDGMQSDILGNVLAQRKRENKPMPKILYVNPTAANPCGVSLSDQRKREIYQLACKYNFLIVEDDPYFFLGFHEKRPQSFLSMDTENRVIRLDSFSKILSSGLRVGFVTGPIPLSRRLELHVQVSSIHASSLSQVILYQLLNKWGSEGFTGHCVEIRKFYRQKRDLMLSAAQKYLTGLAEWNNPAGGMFLWLHVKGIEDAHSLVTKRCIDSHLVFTPGNVFMTDETKPCPYLRISYSFCTEEQIDKAVSTLARLIREEQLASHTT